MCSHHADTHTSLSLHNSLNNPDHHHNTHQQTGSDRSDHKREPPAIRALQQHTLPLLHGTPTSPTASTATTTTLLTSLLNILIVIPHGDVSFLRSACGLRPAIFS